nr:Uncharacterised protein [Ipomoea batatas]GMD79418.1 Uncharacterised protein [Ipomoea batatas]GMD82184.1 Uncharacterised protein [Ipomoea batatas]
MLSSIFVATITGFCMRRHLLMMSSCSKGTSSIGSSAPRSPRATIAYAEAERILCRFGIESALSIFTIT